MWWSSACMLIRGSLSSLIPLTYKHVIITNQIFFHFNIQFNGMTKLGKKKWMTNLGQLENGGLNRKNDIKRGTEYGIIPPIFNHHNRSLLFLSVVGFDTIRSLLHGLNFFLFENSFDKVQLLNDSLVELCNYIKTAECIDFSEIYSYIILCHYSHTNNIKPLFCLVKISK